MSASEDLSKEKFFSMLEKSVKPQFFLLVASFVVFFDSMMVYFSGIGLIGLQAEGSGLSLALGLKLLIGFTIFSGLVSLVFPFLFGIVRPLYLGIVMPISDAVDSWVTRWIGADKDHVPYVHLRRVRDCVRPWDLRQEAHETKSDFLLKLYEDYARHHRSEEVEHYTIQYYAFCALIFTALNFWLPGGAKEVTLTGWIETFFSSTTLVWIALSVFFGMMAAPFHVDRSERKWIYHPPLYHRLEAEDEKEAYKRRILDAEIERNIAEARRARDKNIEEAAGPEE